MNAVTIDATAAHPDVTIATSTSEGNCPKRTPNVTTHLIHCSNYTSRPAGIVGMRKVATISGDPFRLCFLDLLEQVAVLLSDVEVVRVAV